MMRFIIRKFNIYTPVIITIAVLISLFSFTSDLIGQTTQTFTSSGAFSVPDRVIEITVQCWGAGGAGGGSSTSSYGGSGGGGGAYSTGTISVVPNQSISYTVGLGGSGSTGNGTAGGSSSFSTLTANGGGGGGGGGDSGTRGAGGTASGGSTNTTGGNGVTGGTSGGKGGDGANGGTGGNGSTDNDGVAGNFPGGGGGGGEASGIWLWTTSKSGGAGANGQIKITYSTVNVVVSASSGSTTGYYKTLKNAFDKINDGTHKGNISITIYGDLTESSTALLNASGTGSASYNNVNIYPVVSGVTISGSIDGPLIKLDGADNVTIDGRVNNTGSTADLVIENTNTGSGAVTISMDNTAQNNTISYCTIKGSGGSDTNGTINFTSTGSNTGNTITQNNITKSSTAGRTNAVYSSGSNTGNTVSNNNFYDCWNVGASSNFINLASSASDWTIGGNSFYNTTTFLPAGAYEYYGINISNSASGNNFSITGNYFGGNAALCSGTMTIGNTSAQSVKFNPVNLSVGTTTPTSVQGNYIRGITMYSANNLPFTGINLISGLFNVGDETGNNIGQNTGTGSITINGYSTATVSYGINIATSNDVVVSNNNIGSITAANNNAAYGHSFYGIIKNAGAGTLTVSNNLIGSASTAGSINCSSAATGENQILSGISTTTSSALNFTLSGNTIANLSNATTRNHAENSVYGISCAGASTNVLSNNFIHHLSCSSTGTINVVSGIQLTNYSGGNTLKNNIISLGDGLNGKLYAINGIYDACNITNVYYHNTSFISGTITGSTSTNTYAFNNNSWINQGINLKNNIFANLRSGGSGTGKHVALKIMNVSPSVSDYNDLYVSGTNGITGINNTTSCQTLADWRTSTSKDANSISENPSFTITTGSTATEFMPGNDIYGTDLTATVPTDYFGTTRYTDPTMGAVERPLTYKVEVYNGSTLLASYMKLKSAFDKINDGSHTGALTIKLVGSTNEKAKAVLNASGTTTGGGTSSYTSINIYPTISGLKLAGNLNDALILLNGADNITFDGRVNATGSTLDLIIQNTNVLPGAVTLLLDNSAQNNIFQYNIIKGGGGASTNGTFVFGVNGNNSNNTISNCQLTNNGTRRQNTVYSATGNNTGNSMTNNQIYDIWSAGATSYAVNLGSGVSGWTISGNSIYETTTLTPSAANNYYGISISSTSGNGFTISDNYIGGQATQCGGSAMVLGSTSQSSIFYPLYINAGSATASSVQGNRIKNINYSSSSATPFYGIYISAGLVNIGTVSGNAIGDTTSTGNLTLTSGANAVSYGIYVSSASSVNVSNNLIGSINLATTYNSHGFTGIKKTAVAGSFTSGGNKIGSIATANNIRSISSNASQNIMGISTDGTGSNTISNNIIANINNTTGQGNSSMYGISASGAGTTTVSYNFIYNVSLSTTVITNKLAGIQTSSGSNTIYNNIVVLGGNITNGLYSINGLLSENASTDYFYHNTVYLSGSISGETSVYTNAFYKAVTGTAIIKNNILFNARSGGTGNGRHSAISLNSTTGVTSNYNVLYAPNTNGVVGAIVLDAYNATSYANISNWRNDSGGDASSFNIDPAFANAGGFVPANYKPSAAVLGENIISIVPYDFEGATRPITPTMGAFERIPGKVNVYSGLDYQASYTTLKRAFDKINDGTHTGALTVKISANTTENQTATLYNSGYTSGSKVSSYTSVLIYPTSSGITVSGSINGVLINLDGADKVTFDGRVNMIGSTPGMTISNTSTGASTVSIQLNNTAQNDTVRYCNILGGGGGAANATILFGTAGNNSNNVVENNNITNNGTRRANTIYSATGTNVSNIIRYNNIYNNWSASNNSYSINLGTGASAWTISGNSIYATTSFTSGAYSYYGIYISNTSGNGFEISNNYIGGGAPSCGGTALTIGTASSVMYPIYVNVGSTTATSIQGNTIKNISYTSSSATPFYGIYINTGLANVGTVTGNIFGDAATGSITLTGSANTPSSYGIYIASTAAVNVSNNIISSVTASNTSAANAHSFYGIYKTSGAGTLNISSNVVGHGSTASSVITSSASTGRGQILMGIYSAGTGAVTISDNTVANLVNSTTTSSASRIRGIQTDAGSNTITSNNIYNLTLQAVTSNTTGTDACQIGIHQGSATGAQTIEGNNVNTLTNNSSSVISVYGILFTGPTTGTNSVAKNYIYGFSLPNVNPTTSVAQSFVDGIYLASGTVNVTNNIVVLGNGITNNCTIFGIRNLTSSAVTVYHNTILINGTAATGVGWSFGLYENAGSTSVTRDIRNNIFWNTRTGGTSGSVHHCAIYINATTNLTLDYNDYGWVGSFFGEFTPGTYYADLASWKTATVKDANSINTDPLFLNPGGTAPENYKSGIQLQGINNTGVAYDFGNTERVEFTMGAWEYPASRVSVYISDVLQQNYFTLKAAFDAVNAGTHQGVLSIRINSNTNEPGTAALNASGTGSANYSRIVIYPTGPDITVNGNVNGPLVNFQGADNVFLNGSVYQTNTSPGLTVSNTNTGTGASTICFSESAQNNRVSYCILKGSGLGSGRGVVYYATSTSGNGNDNDTISNCNITASTAGRPLNTVYSSGTSGSENDNNFISNNSVYNFLNLANNSNGVLIDGNSNRFTISGNSFYGTATFTPTSASTFNIINISNTSGGGHVISGNYIGGSSALCTGSFVKSGNNNIFNAITINTGTAEATGVYGNVIKNISITNTGNADCKAINITSGLVNVGTAGGNTIGETTGTGSITLSNAATGGSLYGIYISGSNDVNCQNNLIGSLSTTSSNTANAVSLYGIFKTAIGGNTNISNNIIGSVTTENSISANSISSSNIQHVYGVYSAGTGQTTINANEIADLTNATTSTQYSFTRGIMTIDGSNTITNNTIHHLKTSSSQGENYTNVCLVGIFQVSETANTVQTITGNKIFELTNNTTVKIEIYGIFYKGPTTGSPTTHQIGRNFIHTFNLVSTTGAYIHGISMYSGTYTLSNNIVFLGNNITTGCSIWGLWNYSSSPIRIYHNTSYLTGTASSGTSFSYAMRDLSGSATDRKIKNNIFWDERVVSGSIYPHYAIYIENTNNLELDYNDYQFTQYIGKVGTTNYSTLASWQTGTGKDLNTIILNPQLTNLGGILPSDYQPNVTGLSGTPLSEIPTDFGFMERSTTAPTMGAWEYFSNPVEIWNGTIFRNSYPTLKGAFDKINDGTYKGPTGDLIIKIRGNTIETATATLYHSGYNSISNYTKLLIYPARSNIQVKGTLSAPLVDLNGADNVIFDGRLNGNASMYELMLLNDANTTSASTIKFTNSAENNTIRYCKVQGLTTATSGGIVYFSSSSSGNGNDNNCILNNKISIVDNNNNYRVINGVYSEGLSGFENNNDSIKNNEIYDTWSPGVSSNSINIASYSSGFVISGNSIYETTAFTPTAGYTYQAIRINNTSGTGFIISGNYIGGKAAQCQGTAMSLGINTSQSIVYQPIYINAGTSIATSLQGNIIQNIEVRSSNASPFSAIYVNGGTSNIGTSSANTVGSSTGTGSITITNSSGSANAKSYGVYLNTSGDVNINANKIGSITTASSSSTYGHDFYAIYKAAVSGVLTIANNIIGSTSTSGSVNTSSSSSNNNQLLCGVYTDGTGVTNIRNNTIANLLNSTTRNNVNNSVIGIRLNGVNSNANTVEQNFVYGLSCSNTATTSAANMLLGIYVNSGNASLINNIINLGQGISALFGIYGIVITGNSSYTNNIYHNTVYISGTATNTTSNTAAFYKINTAGQTNLKNNILFNARSGGTTGYHYAIYLPGSSNLTINGNDYYVNDTQGRLGYLSGGITTITAWRTATGQDVNSISTNPNFVSAGSTVAADYYPGLGVNLLGLSGTGVNVDYGSYPRSSSSPTMGAWERSNKWKGTTSIDWNTASNWTGNTVPAVDDNIIFDDAPFRPCYMDQDRFVTDIINAQSAFRMVTNGFNLNIKGNLVFTNGAQIDASATGSTVTFNGSSAQTIPSGTFYNDKVYNLTVNNSYNVTLNGTVRLLNNLTATSGLLDATPTGATMIYEGTSEQTIASSQYVNNQAYNITANNAAGVVVNTNFTVLNNAAINSGDKLTIPENIGLTVNGTMTNNAGNAGLLLKSSIIGTASLIHNSNGVAATVQRYVDGDSTVWHFLAPPVSGQPIHGTSWTPSGNYGDGTGYDMYVWDEHTSCWVYNLNTTATPTWTSIHPVDNFIAGRGYLYALLDSASTKSFAGNLNNGVVYQTLTASSDSVQLKGFNFIGNPYPSSIDWSVSAGFSRSMLYNNGGGYDIWTWSNTAENYGVYNSADADGTGTNNVTKFIAPMQGFFVYASTGGTFGFNNAARAHTGASTWLKSAPARSSGKIKLTVSAPESKGSDEIQMRFGYNSNDEGAYKLFSNVKTAPSLFIPYYNKNYAVRRLTTAEDNKKTPLSFRAGVDGKYSITCQFDPTVTDKIFLEDKITGTIHDFSQSDTYTFTAKPGDLQSRFAIHLGEIVPEDNIDLFAVYARAGVLYVDLSNLNDEYEVTVYDLGGKVLHKAKVFGGDVEEVSLSTRGIYMVSLRSQKFLVTKKVVY